jgi:hypothetical protein
VAHFRVAPETLRKNGAGQASFASEATKRLSSDGDVLIEIMMDGQPDMTIGSQLSQRLADALQPAAVLLSRLGVEGIRLADEIEPGVPLGVSLGKLSIPVATMAGAFGDRFSLIRISERIRAVRNKGSFA